MLIEHRVPCPVALAEAFPEIGTFLKWQTDMTGGEGGWHAMPFAGPTQTWPHAVVVILRHIRVVLGHISFKDKKSLAKKGRNLDRTPTSDMRS